MGGDLLFRLRSDLTLKGFFTLSFSDGLRLGERRERDGERDAERAGEREGERAGEREGAYGRAQRRADGRAEQALHAFTYQGRHLALGLVVHIRRLALGDVAVDVHVALAREDAGRYSFGARHEV